MRSAVATRSSLPPVATAIAWTASSSGRRPSGSLPVAPDSGVSVPPRSFIRPPTTGAGLADPAPTAGLADPATTGLAEPAPIPTDRETVALATRATPVAATSESAQTNQNRRSAARRGPSGTSAQRPSPAASSSGRASHVSPLTVTRRLRAASRQPRGGTPGSVPPTARSPASATTAGRDRNPSRTRARDSTRRPTTTLPPGGGARPTRQPLPVTTATRRAAPAGRGGAGGPRPRG